MVLSASEFTWGHARPKYDCGCRSAAHPTNHHFLFCRCMWWIRLLWLTVTVFRLSAHSHVRLKLQQPQPCHQLRRRQQEHHVRGLPWRWTLDVHGGRRLYGSDLGFKVLFFFNLEQTWTKKKQIRANHHSFTFLHRSRNLQCQRIFQVNAPINCVCLHPNQVRRLANIEWETLAYMFITLQCDINSVIFRSPALFVSHMFLFFQGGADCWRPKWRDSHLGSEDRPQRTANPWARGLGQLRPHRPRCQLHGGSQQLGESVDTILRLIFYILWWIVNWFFFLFFCNTRATAMCGTSQEELERRWLKWFPRLRSQHITATPSAASLVQTRRECQYNSISLKVYTFTVCALCFSLAINSKALIIVTPFTTRLISSVAFSYTK